MFDVFAVQCSRPNMMPSMICEKTTEITDTSV
jgi:hypothetical protein